MATTQLEKLELRKEVLEYSVKITTSLSTKIALEHELEQLNQEIAKIENSN
jgi:hypothetical protein